MDTSKLIKLPNYLSRLWVIDNELMWYHDGGEDKPEEVYGLLPQHPSNTDGFYAYSVWRMLDAAMYEKDRINSNGKNYVAAIVRITEHGQRIDWRNDKLSLMVAATETTPGYGEF